MTRLLDRYEFPLLVAFIIGSVWLYESDKSEANRKHDVKVCLMEMGMGQTIYDSGVSQRCRDLIADEAVRLQERKKGANQ